MSNDKEKFEYFEEAFEADLNESKLNRKTFAASMWKDRHHYSAYHALHNKLSPYRKPDFSVNEVINGLKELGKSENSIRYICEMLGYNMPTRKEKSEESTAEQEIKKIDDECSKLVEALAQKVSLKKEMQEKINRVQKCENDYQKTETNLMQGK